MASNPYKPLPFYATYAFFDRAMAYWKKHGAPKRFVSRALRSAAGEEASRIVSGFMGLGWIDEDGIPSSDLSALLEAYGTDSWRPVLREVLERTYAFIPGEWSKLTADLLRAAFRTHAGRPSGSLTGSETFFLTAAAEAGFDLPDAFMNRITRSRPRGADDTPSPQLFETPTDHHTAFKPRGNGAEGKAGARDPVGVLLSLFDEAAMTEKEKAALLTLLFHLRNPHEQRRDQ